MEFLRKRWTGRICKDSKRSLGNRELSLDIGCNIYGRCK